VFGGSSPNNVTRQSTSNPCSSPRLVALQPGRTKKWTTPPSRWMEVLAVGNPVYVQCDSLSLNEHFGCQQNSDFRTSTVLSAQIGWWLCRCRRRHAGLMEGRRPAESVDQKPMSEFVRPSTKSLLEVQTRLGDRPSTDILLDVQKRLGDQQKFFKIQQSPHFLC
jgi:hypothetical protein